MIVPMKKATLIVFREDRDAVTKALQRCGEMMPIPPENYAKAGEAGETLRAEQALKATLGREQRKLLLCLVNAHSLWQERTSLESFTAGLRLGLGIAGALEPCSFDDDQEEQARRKMETEGD